MDPATPVGAARAARTRSARVGDRARRVRLLPHAPADRGALGRLVDLRRHPRDRLRHLGGVARPAPARLGRDRRRAWSGSASAFLATAVERREPEHRLPRRPDRVDVRLLDAARLRRHRRHVLGAQRRREHRPRGDDADGRVLRRLRRRQGRELGRRAPRRDARRRAAGARARLLRDPPARRPDRRAAWRSTSSRSGSPATSSSSSTTARTCPVGVSTIPNVKIPCVDGLAVPRARDRRPEPDGLAQLPARDRVVLRPLQDADRPADPRLRRAPARRRHGRDQRLRGAVRRGRALGRSSPRSAARTSRSASAAARSPTT